MKKEDTVEAVKQKIHKKGGVASRSTRLTFDWNELEDGCPLSHYGIHQGSTLLLGRLLYDGILRLGRLLYDREPKFGGSESTCKSSITGPQIFLKTLTGKSFPIKVEDGDTVGNLKQKLHDEGEVPPNQQRIICAGKELEDDRPLSDSNILSIGTWHLLFKKPSGGSESTSLSSPAGEEKPLQGGIHSTCKDPKGGYHL